MPIYEYECPACGHVFDRLQKVSDPDPETCPQCGKHKVKRRLTAPAFRLAGSGWYETDFKKDGDRKRNLAGKDEAPKPDAAKPAESGGGASKGEPAKVETRTVPATKPAAGKAET